MSENIIIKGARVHNLKNIDVVIPKYKLVVITGLSGSGKSSLAFDTLYAEGQRRYVESLSSYARQFLGNQEKPDVDKIEGLSPAIAIDQRASVFNPRSTVGTMTEIYDLFRVVFTNFGVPHCPKCGGEIKEQSGTEIIKKIWLACQKEEDVLILAPVIRQKKGEHKQVLKQVFEAKYTQVRVDGYICSIEEAMDMEIDKHKRHTIEVVIDQIGDKKGKNNKIDIKQFKGVFSPKSEPGKLFSRLIESGLDLGDGMVVVYDIIQQKDYLFSTRLVCFSCGASMPVLEPALFSFNSPTGACEACGGLGTMLLVDEDLVLPNKKLSLAEGAVRPWVRMGGTSQGTQMEELARVAKKYDFSIDLPINKMSGAQLNVLLYGEGLEDGYPGILNQLFKKYQDTNSSYVKEEMEKYMRVSRCPECEGQRLKKEALSVTVYDVSIARMTQMTIAELMFFLKKMSMGSADEPLNRLMAEIIERLKHLSEVGVEYLMLGRPANTLSGGEIQKVRLATQIGISLTGVVYVLDEPSIGLHQRDNEKLINTLCQLKKLRNSVIVVEHDEETIMAADYVIDVGPGAGKHGGEIVSVGTPREILRDKRSLTGAYLSGKKKIEAGGIKRKGNGKSIQIKGASEFNLKNIDVKIPLGSFVCVTGVSGSGKSTLVEDILSRALQRHYYKAKELPGRYKEISGLQFINKVVTIDQSPIGRTPRSNPATYTGVFTHIRDLFALQPEARIKHFDAGFFSFNIKGGRCEECQGDGVKKLEMNYLPDVYLPCEECHGRRYKNEALEIYWQGKNIADVLDMTVEEARCFFEDTHPIREKLHILSQVGLGYIHLGQPATTLSGGEAQRVKLATELSRKATGKTLYILDEPTIGLHFDDVQKLLKVLNKLVDKGNTVLVVEHNLHVIKSADYIIDLGPEGGDGGGEVVVAGTPEEVAACPRSWTGKFLKKVIG